MIRRAMVLAVVIVTTVALVACGRASQEQINAALGITPTPTLSAANMTATAQAVAALKTRTAASNGSPGAAGPVGNVASGNMQFQTQCAGCHQPGGGGAAPDILAKGSAGSKVTYQTLLPLVRQGKNHTPPGPYTTLELTDQQVADLVAYILSQAGQ